LKSQLTGPKKKSLLEIAQSNQQPQRKTIRFNLSSNSEDIFAEEEEVDQKKLRSLSIIEIINTKGRHGNEKDIEGDKRHVSYNDIIDG
jgi:hypothetical protein